MKKVWLVQSKDDKYVVDADDNEVAAKDCADYYRGWIPKCYSVDVESEFIKPDDWEDYDD